MTAVGAGDCPLVKALRASCSVKVAGRPVPAFFVSVVAHHFTHREPMVFLETHWDTSSLPYERQTFSLPR